MDPVINSLVQSPLVRSMSTVPSKASSFVHGVSDNVPPFSYQKVVVEPWNNPSVTSQNQVHKFRIPQYGTLNRAYLRIKMINQIPDPASTRVLLSDYAGLHDEQDDSLTVDSDYDTVKGKIRIPWQHEINDFTIVNHQMPFGGGGVSREPAPSNVGSVLDRFSNRRENVPPENYLGTASNAWNVINILSEIRLMTNGKRLETIPAEVIPSEVIKMPPGLRDFYIRGMTGWSMGTHLGAVKAKPDYRNPWDPTACHRDPDGLLQNDLSHNKDTEVAGNVAILSNQHAHFTVPVPLSSLKVLSKNFQTRFVEDLELEVSTKEIERGFNEYVAPLDATKHHEVELVLIYHNWHDNVENTIRNSNYKRGVPASVYCSNWMRGGVTAVATSNTAPISIRLTSRNLITELVIVARSKATNNDALTVLKGRKSDYTIFHQGGLEYDIELTGSGKTIWSGSSQELLGPDTSDYDLSDRRIAGGDGAYGGIQRRAPSRISYGRSARGNSSTDQGQAPLLLNGPHYNHNLVTQCGVDYSFGDNMAIMRFGLQTTDEFYSGGIALQTISNPTIKLTPRDADVVFESANSGWLDRQVEFDVYVKLANLVRIDSDTGTITRTLDV